MSGRPLAASYRIRDFVGDDVDACLDVFDSNVPDFFRAEERTELAAFLGALPGPYLVITDPMERVVACGGYAVGEATSVDLCWGMVRRPLQGVGLGRLLTEARLDRALADPGVRSIALSTSHLTTAFYERFGFCVVGVVADGYGPGLDRCDMRLDIALDS